jgi:hypothetical protein
MRQRASILERFQKMPDSWQQKLSAECHRSVCHECDSAAVRRERAAHKAQRFVGSIFRVAADVDIVKLLT